MSLPDSIIYPSYNGGEVIQVDRLGYDDVNTAMAAALLWVKAEAYTAQLETGSSPALEKGLIQRAFRPLEPASIENTCVCLESQLKEGTESYWVVRGEEPSELIKGFIQVHHEYQDKAMHISNITVSPQHRTALGRNGLYYSSGIGRRLVHAAARYGPDDRHGTVTLHSYANSSVNDWYRRLGFVTDGAASERYIGSNPIIINEYALTHGVTVGDFVVQLETLYPELTGSIATEVS